MKAIDTQYKGCKFRSRLEARWAVFFDALGVEWQYEKEGYELSAGRYLPDFWLPYEPMKNEGWGYWVEIKPVALTQEESALLGELAKVSGHRSYAICGNPWPSEHSVSVFEHHHNGVPASVPAFTGGQIVERDRHAEPGFVALAEEWDCSLGLSPYLELVAPDGRTCCFPDSYKFFSLGTCSLIQAFEAAREARFEHGEAPTFPPTRNKSPKRNRGRKKS